MRTGIELGRSLISITYYGSYEKVYFHIKTKRINCCGFPGISFFFVFLSTASKSIFYFIRNFSPKFNFCLPANQVQFQFSCIQMPSGWCRAKYSDFSLKSLKTFFHRAIYETRIEWENNGEHIFELSSTTLTERIEHSNTHTHKIALPHKKEN